MVELALPQRFVLYADALDRAGRAPLHATLMRAAGQDIAAGGTVARLLDGIELRAGSVPALRVLAALHFLVLSGRAPQLAEYYPTAGGDRASDGVWDVALRALDDNATVARERVLRPVQTNEPGRSAVLYPALLWLTARDELPIRLLELGASAGINLVADRFAYVVDGVTLGAADSPLRFDEPWSAAPEVDLASLSDRLAIASRAGCDPAPLDPTDDDDRLTLLSYVWADEVARFERLRAALEVVVADPPSIVATPAQDWLPQALASTPPDTLTVIWESVIRQYIPDDDWASIDATIAAAQSRAGGGPVVWLAMEPGEHHFQSFELRVRTSADGPWQSLARCGDHGPPVAWGA